MINGAQEVGFLLLQRQISLSAIRALLSIMVTYNVVMQKFVYRLNNNNYKTLTSKMKIVSN